MTASRREIRPPFVTANEEKQRETALARKRKRRWFTENVKFTIE
jgi:hypothetical protein